jgi:hypothetical protein
MSKIRIEKAIVLMRDDARLWSAANDLISEMHFSVRLRTSSFSFSILACDTDSGRGFGFRCISGCIDKKKGIGKGIMIQQ